MEMKMKLGFCTAFSEDAVKFAAEAGFRCLELFAQGPLDPGTITKTGIRKTREVLDKYGIVPASIFYHGDYAAPRATARKQAATNLKKTMDVAQGLGTNIITTIARVPEDASLKDKLSSYKKSFGTFAKWFEDRGMKLAIENWPANHGNIAWTVANWEAMFGEVPSKAIGLEYDPSHLLWQRMDYKAALRDFADRVYMFHAKDTQIFYNVLARHGIDGGQRWWQFRVPGYGEVDWKGIFQILSDVGYAGNMVIEHEDPVFDGPRRKEGFLLGLKRLQQYIVQG
jgi:sugar phosphate isomerase/epimerase